MDVGILMDSNSAVADGGKEVALRRVRGRVEMFGGEIKERVRPREDSESMLPSTWICFGLRILGFREEY